MCGIAGIVQRDPGARADVAIARRMADEMFHRGPDDGGVFSAGPAALAHRRLKIIDLSERGAQPMSTPDGAFTISFNGEIYNYRDLRAWLEGHGTTFRSSSDTEVLLQMYVREGRAMLDRLNGIFAFAIWDRERQVLVAARDHMGVKPLYYALDERRFIFASEVKGLLAGGWSPSVDPTRVGEYLRFGSIAGDDTLFRGVRRLAPGGWLEFSPTSGLRLGTYFEIGRSTARLDISPEEATRRVRDGVRLAIERQMIADVPVGSMCSGGLDSSLVTTLAATHLPAIDTYCVKIPVEGFDESRFGSSVAQHVGATHHELLTREDDVATLLSTLVWLHDEPLTHPNSAPIFQISRLARERVIVLLSGEGADEVFGGYHRYRRQGTVAALRSWIPPPLLRLAGRGAPLTHRLGLIQLFDAANSPRPADALAYLGTKTDEGTLRTIAPDCPTYLDTRLTLAAHAWESAHGDVVNAALLNDQLTHLQTLLARQDKMCMGTSVESRVPFLDIDLVRLANSLPSSMKLRRDSTKAVLRDAVGAVLPSTIHRRPKYAFALPLRHWMRRGSTFSKAVRAMEHGHLVREGILSWPAFRPVLESVEAGSGQHADVLWYAANLEVWWRVFIARDAEPDLSQMPAYRDAPRRAGSGRAIQ